MRQRPTAAPVPAAVWSSTTETTLTPGVCQALLRFPRVLESDARATESAPAAVIRRSAEPAQRWALTSTFPALQPISSLVNQTRFVCLSTRCNRSSCVGYGMRMAWNALPHKPEDAHPPPRR